MATTPSISPPAPLQQITLTKSDMDDPSLLNNQLTNIVQMLNYILGHGGEPPYLKAGANFGGQPVRNVGAPESDTDVVPFAFANSKFGAAAIAPQIQALGKNVLQSYRRINDRVQQERYSTFLNSALGVSPTSNTSVVIPGTPSGGFVPVTITAGFHQYVDGHQEPYAAFNDSLTLPTNYAIASMTRTGGVVTGTTTGINVLGPNETVVISGAADPSFDGQQLLVAPTSTLTFTFNQSGPNTTTTGGIVSLNGIYYYSRRVGQSVLFRTGPFAADLWTTRLSFAGGTNPSLDGSTLIAVVSVNASGVDMINSAAGSTPPVSNIGAGVRLFGRL